MERNSDKGSRQEFKMQNYKLKIIFLGTPSYVDPIVQSLETNFELIKTFRSPKESLDGIKDMRPDLLVVASFGKIIPQAILEIPKLGAINIHPSKLPKYRGPSPIQSQILDGVTDSAISFILMDEEMDHGPILHQEDFSISNSDTFESLREKMFERSAEILPKIINEFADGKLKPLIQNHAMASFCISLKKEDGYFDIGNPPDSQTLNRMIRAYYPWPGVWTKWKNKSTHNLTVGVSSLDRTSSDSGKPMTSQSGFYRDKIVKFVPNVSRITYHVSPFLIQMEGKKVMTLKEFLNGHPDFPLKNI